jgi:hypothetical protein
VLWVVAMAVVTAPMAVLSLAPGLDASWVVALHEAHRHGLVWGPQVIWTYGPYGFLHWPYYVYFETWLPALIARVVVNTGYLVVFALFLLEARAALWAWATAGLLFLLPLPDALTIGNELLLASLLLFHLASNGRWRYAPALVVPAGACLAFLVLLKGSGVSAALLVIGCFVGISLVRRRPLAAGAAVAVTVAAFAVLWFSTGSPVSAIAGYLRGTYEIIAGYTPAMAIFHEYPISQETAWTEVSLGLALVAAAAAAATVALLRRDVRTFSLLLLSLPFLLVMFKEVYVRFGGRAPALYAIVLLAELPVVLHCMGAIRRWPQGIAPLLSVALCVVLLLGAGSVQFKVPPGPWQAQTLGERLASYREAARLVLRPTARDQMDDQARARFRAGYDLPPKMVETIGDGTFDAFPVDAGIAYAYGFRPDPRPVIQSYSAYTPYLDSSDAAHYRGGARPDHVLVSYGSIDGRYPLFDEPATFRALMDCYRPVASSDSFVLAGRIEPACPARPLRLLRSTSTRLGSYAVIPRPSSGHVFAKIDVQYSLVGKALELAFQPAELHVRFQLRSGQESGPYRYIPALGPDGPLVSSYVSGQRDLERVLGGGQVNPVNAVEIVPERNLDYNPTVHMDFYTDA